MGPPPLQAYFELIHRAFEDLPVSYSSELWCEPGRALCAEYASVLVRVEKRRGDTLYFLGSDGKIRHTGLYLGDDQFVQAVSPRVRINSFNPKDDNYDDAHFKNFAFAKRLLD